MSLFTTKRGSEIERRERVNYAGFKEFQNLFSKEAFFYTNFEWKLKSIFIFSVRNLIN